MDILIKNAFLFMKYFVSGFGIPEDSYYQLWIKIWYSRIKFPVLYKNSIHLYNLEEIKSNEISKIMHYRVPLYHVKEHTTICKNLFFSDLPENEAIIFDFYPKFSTIINPRKFICSFCKMLNEIESVYIECIVFQDLITKLAIPQVQTKIDHLLFEGSYFSQMLEPLKGFVAHTKRFEFKEPIISESENQEITIYTNLVAINLLQDFPNIQKLYIERYLMYKEPEREISSSGTFVYDSSDPFIEFIINNNQIESNESLKFLVKLYFRLLAINSLESFSLGSYSSSALRAIEYAIGNILEYSGEIIPYEERISDFSKSIRFYFF